MFGVCWDQAVRPRSVMVWLTGRSLGFDSGEGHASPRRVGYPSTRRVAYGFRSHLPSIATCCNGKRPPQPSGGIGMTDSGQRFAERENRETPAPWSGSACFQGRSFIIFAFDFEFLLISAFGSLFSWATLQHLLLNRRLHAIQVTRTFFMDSRHLMSCDPVFPIDCAKWGMWMKINWSSRLLTKVRFMLIPFWLGANWG